MDFNLTKEQALIQKNSARIRGDRSEAHCG